MTLLQEKIAKSLQLHEQNLAGSQYGKYFVRNMNLLLLKRDPDAWRAQQSSKKEVSTPSTSGKKEPALTPALEKPPPEQTVALKLSSKRKRKESDDIDKLFDSTLGKRQKRTALPPVQEEHSVFSSSDAPGLEGVLGAIKAAPKGDKDGKHKKKKVR